MTVATATRTLPGVPHNQATMLIWAVAGAMVIAVAAIVIALVALTRDQAVATHDPGAPVRSTHTSSDLCFPTHVVHPC